MSGGAIAFNEVVCAFGEGCFLRVGRGDTPDSSEFGIAGSFGCCTDSHVDEYVVDAEEVGCVPFCTGGSLATGDDFAVLRDGVFREAVDFVAKGGDLRSGMGEDFLENGCVGYVIRGVGIEGVHGEGSLLTLLPGVLRIGRGKVETGSC